MLRENFKEGMVGEMGIREEIEAWRVGLGVKVAALMKAVRKINESLLEQAAESRQPL